MSTKSDRRRQVVGVDGSPGSKHALAWAVARADHLGPVEPVSAWHYPWWAFVPTGTNALVPLNEKEFDNVARRLVDQSLEGIDRRQVLDAYVSHGSAGDALVQAGETASLIVVGTRGHGSLTGSLLGSVSRHCVNHATVPVAVIPSESPVDDRFGAVVVGYDRSENAERAIEWAIENSPPATEIRVVHVWSPSSTATAQTAAMAFDLLSAESLDLVRKVVAKFESHPDLGDRRLTAHSESGDARHVLRSLAQEADLMVVGARGGGGVGYLLLGSVSSALLSHPTAATVVVR